MAIRKILIVDDSPTDRRLITNILTLNGYQVGTANCGEEALEKTKDSMPDLILMDVVMPGLNGFQATRMITKNMDTQHIPVIMCTNKSLETDKIWGLRQGAKDYIIKPIVADTLLHKIKVLIEKQKTEIPKKKMYKKAEPKDYEVKVLRSKRNP